MKVIAAHKQETEPGKDSAMEGAVAEDKRRGSSTARSLQDDEVFAKHLAKGTEPAAHLSGKLFALPNAHGGYGAYAGEHPKFIPPAYKRIEHRAEGRAECDSRCNRPEHSAHGASLNLIGIAVPDNRQSDGDDSATSHAR